MMRAARDVLILACLGLLCFILGAVAWHVPSWLRIVDKTMLHIDEFAGEGKIAMKNLAASSMESKKSAQIVSQELPGMIQNANGSLARLNIVLDSANSVAQDARGTLSEASGAIRATTDTIETFQRQTVRIGDSITLALDSVPSTLESSRQLMESSKIYIDGPLTSTTRRADEVLLPTSWLLYDTQQKVHGWLYPAPYTGKFKALHQTWGITRGLFPLTQPSYYLIKIAKGE